MWAFDRYGTTCCPGLRAGVQLGNERRRSPVPRIGSGAGSGSAALRALSGTTPLEVSPLKQTYRRTPCRREEITDGGNMAFDRRQMQRRSTVIVGLIELTTLCDETFQLLHIVPAGSVNRTEGGVRCHGLPPRPRIDLSRVDRTVIGVEVERVGRPRAKLHAARAVAAGVGARRPRDKRSHDRANSATDATGVPSLRAIGLVTLRL